MSLCLHVSMSPCPVLESSQKSSSVWSNGSFDLHLPDVDLLWLNYDSCLSWWRLTGSRQGGWTGRQSVWLWHMRQISNLFHVPYSRPWFLSTTTRIRHWPQSRSFCSFTWANIKHSIEDHKKVTCTLGVKESNHQLTDSSCGAASLQLLETFWSPEDASEWVLLTSMLLGQATDPVWVRWQQMPREREARLWDNVSFFSSQQLHALVCGLYVWYWQKVFWSN